MIQKVAQSFGSLTMIRILSRVFQFILKTYLIRNLLDKQILGHMVHLDLIITTSLHILKSCFKPSYQKVTDKNQINKNIHSGMNLMNIGIFISTICAIIICFIQLYQYQNQHQTKKLLNFNYCIIIYGFSVLFEALFEKFNVINVLKYSYIKSAFIQMASFLPKSLFIFIAAQLGMFQEYGILVFGIGHIIYTSLLMIISFITIPSQFKNIYFIKIPQNNQLKKEILQQKEKQNYYYIDPATKQSVKQFSTLSILKMLLQQFEKIILVTFDISSFSSTYTLISNLGSIVVRYLFAPLQEIVYNYFSRGEQKQSVKTLILLLRSLILFSCLSLTFGYNYSQAFLGFLYGQKWVSDDSVFALKIYTVFLSVIGINGIMEAFLFAKGVQSFRIYKYLSIIPTLIYVLFSFYFISILQIGTASFFLANTISMLIKIIISWNLQIKKHISLKQFLFEIKPSNLFLISLFITFLLGNQSFSKFSLPKYQSHLKNMCIGGFLFMINVLVIAFDNKQMVKQKIKSIFNKLKKKNQ